MNNEFLEFLKSDPNVFYIYNRGSIIYKRNSETSDVDFLIVVNDKFQIPKRFKKYKRTHHFKRQIKFNIKIKNYDFILFNVNEWFNMVMNNHMYAWECACLNKKFVHKEHVKLLLNTDLVKLRTNFDKKYSDMIQKATNALNNNHLDVAQKILWYLLKDGLFTLQIIENHKIINYTSANNLSLHDCTNENIFDTFQSKIQSIREQINKHTDGIIQLNTIKKYANI